VITAVLKLFMCCK